VAGRHRRWRARGHGRRKLQKTDSELRLVGDAEHPIAISIERSRDRDLTSEP
jgi:hypothetical protein